MRSVDRLPIFAIVAMLGLASPAVAQENVEGAARTASVMSAIVRYCSPFYVVDGPKASKLGAVGLDLVQQWAPKGRAKAILGNEASRRVREVEAAGPRYWCQNQREVHKNLGTGLFLN